MADGVDSGGISDKIENEMVDPTEQPAADPTEQPAAGTPETADNEDGDAGTLDASDADNSERPGTDEKTKPEAEVESMVQQELEEMELMTQAATAAVEEHMAAAAMLDGPGQQDQPAAFLTTDPRQPLHDHRRYGNAPGNRFPSLTPNKAHIARLPSPRGGRGQHLTTSKVQMLTRSLNPTKMTFLSKVTMSARVVALPKVSIIQRAQVSTSHPSNYVLAARRPRKVVTWDEAMSARPPLRVDMEGPTPCSYTPATKPLLETNAPQWSFGAKSFVEKPGGARTSWEKTWFQSPDVWTQKADFRSDRRWPQPSQYHQQPAMGPHHPVARAGHSHSIGVRRAAAINKKGSEAEPSPNDYSRETSDMVTGRRAPAFTHSLRRGGTVLWAVGESLDTPGPGTYNPQTKFVHTHKPAFTIQGIRREKSHVLGPYATF